MYLMPHDIKKLVHTILHTDANWKVQLLRDWQNILGNLGTKVHLEKIHDDTLVLGVSDSCWMQELYMLSHLLINKINQRLDRPRIKKLRFKTVGDQPRMQYKPTPKQEYVVKNITLNPTEQRALEKIKDPQLQDALKGFLIRCYQEK